MYDRICSLEIFSSAYPVQPSAAYPVQPSAAYPV